MKGMLTSPTVFLLLISTFSLTYVFSLNTAELREIAAQDILANRIYYKFLTISDSTSEIIEKELGDIKKLITFNVTVDELPDYSYVNFTEKLPQNVTEFNQDLARYENFVETYLNETNVKVDTGIGGLGGRMRSVVEPYDIVYDHIPPWGQRQFSITPNNSEDSLGNLNSYTLTIQLVNGETVIVGSGEWTPKKKGDLKVTITTISDGGVPVDKTTEYLSRYDKSQYLLLTSIGWIRVIISWGDPGSLLFEMHSTDAIVTTSLNLTEMPGKTEVDLPDGHINVIENIYNVEKDGTAYIT